MSEYRVLPTANKKYIRAVLAALPKGFRIGMVEVQSDGTRPARLVHKSHPVVISPDGNLLRDADGRVVTVAGTPGSVFALKNDVKKIQRAWEEKAA